MFEARVSQTRLRSAVSVLELIYFSIVRQIRQTHRNAVIGLVLDMTRMIMMVLAFYVMFQLLGLRSSPVRGDYLLYIMSGIFVYMTHIKTVNAVFGSEGPTSAMMQHAPMNTAISICASALAALYTQVLSVSLILLIYHIGFVPITIDQPIQTFGMLLAGWFFGVAVGVVFLALKPWIPDIITVLKMVYTRVNMIASGKMFLANTLPASMLPFFDWNPLFHIIDQSRGFMFLHYNPHFTNTMYPIYISLAVLMIGLMGEFYTRSNASASWEAGR